MRILLADKLTKSELEQVLNEEYPGTKLEKIVSVEGPTEKYAAIYTVDFAEEDYAHDLSNVQVFLTYRPNGGLHADF